MGWFEKACEELEVALENDEITNEQYKSEMRELRQELNEEVLDAAESAYNDVMG